MSNGNAAENVGVANIGRTTSDHIPFLLQIMFVGRDLYATAPSLFCATSHKRKHSRI